MKSLVLSFKTVSLLLTFLAPIYLFGLNYTISFTGSGASSTVESVIVQNLTKGTIITVPAGNVLNLTDVTTSVDNLSISADGIKIFPNPIKDYSNISFYAKKGGQTQISAYSLDGRKIIGITEKILQGNNTFKLSLPKGVYLIKIYGNEFSYHTKAISESTGNPTPNITFSQSGYQKNTKPQKARSEVTTMLYSAGDQLLYKGYSSGYTTIISDTPNESKSVNFYFAEVIDVDGNKYNTVTIGTQVWLLENLKVTHFQDGSPISNFTNNFQWENASIGAWRDYNDSQTNGDKYGHLYNWYAASDSRNIAPFGWRVPTDNDWTILENYLNSNFGVSINSAKALASKTGWTTVTNYDNTVIGQSSSLNNSSNFTALPDGICANNINNIYFSSITGSAYFWTCEQTGGQAWYRALYYFRNYVERSRSLFQNGMSIRCVKN